VLVLLAASAAWIAVWRFDRTGSPDGKPLYRQQQKLKELEVAFLDVRQGDSIFIRTPNGRVILIDAGQGASQYVSYDAGQHTILPFLAERGITRIDTLVMTHPHSDHYGGMAAVVDSVEIGEYLDPGMDHPAPTYLALLETILEKKITYREISAPMTLDWDPDILVQVLWPEKGFATQNPNDISIVIRLVYGDIVYLLAADIETDVESVLNLYGDQLRTTILKVPHHGSDTSSSYSFLEHAIPRLAVISVGHNNRFDHPSDDILTRYEKLDIAIMRTDRHGTVRTMTDGKVVHVHPELGTSFDIFPFPSIPPEEEAL
jgi:competence protein ComEC